MNNLDEVCMTVYRRRGDGDLIGRSEGSLRPDSVLKVLETNHASLSLLKCFVAGKMHVCIGPDFRGDLYFF